MFTSVAEMRVAPAAQAQVRWAQTMRCSMKTKMAGKMMLEETVLGKRTQSNIVLSGPKMMRGESDVCEGLTIE